MTNVETGSVLSTKKPVLVGVLRFDTDGKLVDFTFSEVTSDTGGRTAAALAAFKLGKAMADGSCKIPGLSPLNT